MFESGDVIEYRFTNMYGEDTWERAIYYSDNHLQWSFMEEGRLYHYLKDRVEVRRG